MPAPLRISTSLALPIDAVTQTFGILAIKGVGKTYTELKMGEEFLKADLQTIFIDAMGVCWGLRASADGRGPGLSITIMGGDHADVPLVPTAGKVVADLLARENFPCILDISDFRKGEQRRFVMDFSEEFYHLKKQHRHPVHLFLDEADMWTPQRPEKGYERLLGAIEDLVRRGRARGIGVTMATQRPAVLNKDVLSQISVLIAMQMSSPHDIDAVDYWVKSNGTREQRDELLKSLASLEKGEAWVWSPAWLKVFKRIKIALRETFDSSKTPEVGEKLIQPKKLAPVDIERIRTAIASTVEQVKNDDPKLLKQRIVDLTRQLATARAMPVAATKPAPVPERPKPIEVRAISRSDLHSFREYVSKVEKAVEGLRVAIMHMEKPNQRISEGLKGVLDDQLKLKLPLIKMIDPREVSAALRGGKTLPPPKSRSELARHAIQRQNSDRPELGDQLIKLRAGERAMLTALCQFGPGEVPHAKVGMMAGFPYTGDTYSTYFGTLKRFGLAEEKGDMGWATDDGRKFLGSWPELPTDTAGLVEMWSARLRAGERKILEAVVAAYPNAMSVEQLAEATGISNYDTFSTYIGTLKRNCLVTTDGQLMETKVKADSTLFPEGVHA